MAERGGYQRPSNPAPVSGPGRLSRRTDGGPGDSQPVRRLPDAGYGESRDFEAQQQGASVAQSSPGQGPRGNPVDTSGIIPMEAPTAHPDQDIMSGATTGVEAQEPGEFDIMRLRSWFPALKVAASRPNASPATRQLVRQLEAYM